MTRTCRLSGFALALAVSVATPAVADTLLVYSQAALAQQSSYFQWCLEGEPSCDAEEPGGQPPNPSAICGAPEGGTFQRHTARPNGGNDGYVGWGVFPWLPLDMTDYAGGNLRWFVKVDESGFPPLGDENVKLEFECNPDTGTYPTGVSYTTFITDHGWQKDDTWQEIVVPLVDASFTAFKLIPGQDAELIVGGRPLDNACLSTVKALAKTTIEGVQVPAATMSIDYIRWEKPNTHTGATKVETQGRKLIVNGKPFVVNAVDYAPVGIGENWRAAWRDRADRYDVDFPLIADMGANAVRLYAPLLTTAMLDGAWAEGLFVIPTFGVDAIQLECAAGKASMQDRFVDMVNQWKDHPAILFWLVGNEVNLNLGAANLCTDWYPQLDAMAAAAHAAEGASFHPVGTAVGGMTDVCTACSDDLDLPNVDLWGVQLYLGCDFGTAFSDYDLKPDCDRPLVVTEFGVDAYDDPLGENQALHASCLDTALEDAHIDLAVRTGGLGVLSGQAIFEWADEWWKAECDPGTSWLVQDTCASSTNGAFPDGKVHEEWFGIANLVKRCSTAGTICNADSDCPIGQCSTTTTTPCHADGDCPFSETCIGGETCDAIPTERGLRTAYDTVGEKWLGPVCKVVVDAYNPGTDSIDISFTPAAGDATAYNLYFGPLNAVSSHSYSDERPGLTTTGTSTLSSTVLLNDPGDLFWVVAAENSSAKEGCYGTDSAGTERPCFSGSCGVDQVSGWNCWCKGSP